MQILEPAELSTFQDEEGYYIDSYLISTKPNEANWKIKKETGHEKVKTFLGKDFPIIPELIHKPIDEGGGGHAKGNRQEILDIYSKFSHGKIWKLKGPYYYQDGTDDYYYRAITKLSGSRAASVLMNEGQRTWVNYAVSPHIFVYKGNDLDGWEDWEGAGLCLVIKGAYGPESIVTKLCKGSEASCSKSLVASITLDPQQDQRLADIISSSISKSASVLHTMPENNTSSATSSQAANPSVVAQTTSNPTVNPQKSLTEGQIQQIQQEQQQHQTKASTVEISAEELAKLKERADSFTEMENERKNEILTTLLSPYITDEKERKEEIKEYAKLEMKTIKLLRSYHESLAPKIEASIKARIEAEQKEAAKKEKEAEKDDKKSKSRAASTLRPEPRRFSEQEPPPPPEGEEEEEGGGESQARAASVTKIRNEAYLLRQKLFGGISEAGQ